MIEQCILAMILIKSLVWTRSLVTLMGNGTEFNRRAKKATSSTQSRYYCGVPPEMPNAKHNGTKEQVSLNLNLKNTYAKKSTIKSYKILVNIL